MTILHNKRGTWINQFAKPSVKTFTDRAAQVDYTIIKYGLAGYEKEAAKLGHPWLAERMAETGVGHQDGPLHAARFGRELANQANQPGCVGAVVNLEEADGGWHTDNGEGTKILIQTFRTLAPDKPLFASLDTRGIRPNYPYQMVCAAQCDGVMPMVYPGAFGQTAPVAFAAAITDLVRLRWKGKEIIPTYQTYSPPAVDVHAEVAEVRRLHASAVIQGANTYTMGHATQEQWNASLNYRPEAILPGPPTKPGVDIALSLAALRKLWVNGWHRIEQSGNAGEATQFAAFWERLINPPPAPHP